MKDKTADTPQTPNSGFTRRAFVEKGALFSLVGLSGATLLSGCADNTKKEQAEAHERTEAGEEEVSPTEDLMREHGLLKRILLIYSTSISRLNNNESLSPEVLDSAAGIVRRFIEDYHERLEEDYLFPRFENANKLTDLVQVLRAQHEAGREVTDQILQFTKRPQLPKGDDRKRLVYLLSQFNRMYAPHEAREDTVLFPALRQIVSSNEYDALGEDFEKKEHSLFGVGGFTAMVDKVAGLEKQLGIYDLSQFTPKV